MINYVILLVMTLTAAGTPIFGRLALEGLPPLALGLTRFGLAAVLLLITLFLVMKGNLKFNKDDHKKIFWLGLICIPLNQSFFLGGLSLSAASHAGLIYGLSPVLVLIFSLYSKYEKVSGRKIFGFILSFCGVAYLFIDSGFSLSSDYLLGDFLLFFAVLTWAAYVTYSKPLVVEYGALKVNAAVFSIGVICFVPIASFDFVNIQPEKITTSVITGFIYLSIITSFIGYFLWAYILKRMDTTKVVIMSNLAPLLAVMFGVIFLNEPLTSGLIVGSVFTVSGIFIVQLSS